MIPLEEARHLVLSSCQPLPPRRVPAADALGCVTSEPIVAMEAIPAFANTAMDGYALRAEDTAGAGPEHPVKLEVVGTLAAGDAPGDGVGPGQAVRIMTGAPLPPGADAVVMVELTETHPGVPTGADGSPPSGEAVLVRAEVAPGNHVRGPGEDLAPGEEVVPAKTELTPAYLGVLASLGVTAVTAHPPPRVGVLSTGNELVQGGEALHPGQIRDTNRPTLLALARSSGFEALDLGCARDTESEIAAALEQGLESCDAVVTTGGVSVGDFDYTKAVLDRLTAGTMRWMQVAIRPAKPFAFGIAGRTPVFGLPGNPVSSMVSFECFARPALRAMMGHTSLDRPEVMAVSDHGLPR
ncbi:MAG TPA: gephyrin-like molybdotransferase Glp, partial [Acidimicrobiales bacterium]|nr:gephyrin-like molybdotransferase Glp [Acidimicrobiales bacterium]